MAGLMHSTFDELIADSENIITNAKLVLPDESIHGSIGIINGRIASIAHEQSSRPDAEDWEGDWLMPGLIDLHTDHMERQYQPRAGVTWDAVCAAMSHDCQLAASGITTAFDSLTVGAASGWDTSDELLEPMIKGLETARDHKMLRIDHYLHLRCEITNKRIVNLVEHLRSETSVHLLSVMDHAPGDRQSPDVQAYRDRYASSRMTDTEIDRHIDELISGSKLYGYKNAVAIAEIAKNAGLPLATHDDASTEHISLARDLGATISEFPTTKVAAEAARASGLAILMGSPNLIRGGSHSGNVSAGDLAQLDLLDVVSSDYIPASLIQAVNTLTLEPFSWPLHRAVACATSRPASLVGLKDRGILEQGLRADFIRVRPVENRLVIKEVYTRGRRIA